MSLPPYTRNMRQTATYWPPIGIDNFGQTTYGSPAQIMCRWQDVAVLFRGPDGQERTSSAVVYPAQELAVKGKLRLGTHTGSPTTEAKEIRQIGSSPSLGAGQQLWKVWL